MQPAVRSKHGFTLIEVILALTITAGACTATAMLLNAVANTWSTNDGISDAVNTARNGMLHVRSYIENARFLGIRDGTCLLLWSGDLDGDTQPDYYEMTLIRYQSADKKIELVDIYFPPGTPQSEIDTRKRNLAQSEYSTTTAVITEMSGDSYARVRTLAENVDQFSITLDNPSPNARYVTLSMTVSRKGTSQSFQTVITPRSTAYYLVP